MLSEAPSGASLSPCGFKHVMRTMPSWLATARHTVVPLLRRFVSQDGGQDLVEYALLAGFVATAGMLVLLNLQGDIANVYSSWLNPSTGVPSLWDPETSVPAAGS